MCVCVCVCVCVLKYDKMCATVTVCSVFEVADKASDVPSSVVNQAGPINQSIIYWHIVNIQLTKTQHKSCTIDKQIYCIQSNIRADIHAIKININIFLRHETTCNHETNQYEIFSG